MQPRKFKYTKLHKKKFKSLKYKTLLLKFGQIGLKAVESGFLSVYQLKAIKFTLSKKLKRQGKLWFHTFPNIPITAKPVESRMGKGKGSVKHWAVFLTAGSFILEIFSKLPVIKLASFLKEAQIRLPIKTKIFY